MFFSHLHCDYYYDDEIGLYYLSSRHYDAEIGRFISCDAVQIIILSLNNVESNIFAYCENNCINKVDFDGYKSNTFFAGFGVQIEIGASLGFFGGTVGVEFVWYTSNLVSGKKGWPIAYWYYSFAVGCSVENKLDSYIDKLIKRPNAMFSTKISISASVCAFAIWGYKKDKNGKKKFSSPDHYLGSFTTRSGTLWHVKGYLAQSQNCYAIGAGYDVSKWAASSSTSNYMYCNFLNKRICAINSLYNFIFKKAKNLK